MPPCFSPVPPALAAVPPSRAPLSLLRLAPLSVTAARAAPPPLAVLAARGLIRIFIYITKHRFACFRDG